MSKNLDQVDGKNSGIIKLKNPNILQSERLKGFSEDFLSENELSEMNEEYKSGRWHPDEHYRFIKGCLQYGNNWKKVKECVKTRSSAQIRSHAQKYIIKLCKKFNIQENNKNMKSFKNIKRKLPSDLMDDINWEKALEWNGDTNFENTNLNMEEIEEIILGIFKSNVCRSMATRSLGADDKEILNATGNEEKKMKVFETIKEPKNSLKRKQHRIHLHNQMKKGTNSVPIGVNNNHHHNNNNMFNMNLMTHLGLNDPHLQMILGNNILPQNTMNFNLGNFTPNMPMNSQNFNNSLGWDQLMNNMNYGFTGNLPPTAKKEEIPNKNNILDNNLLGLLLNQNQNICMDYNNDELLRNLMKGSNNGMMINNMMSGFVNPNNISNNTNNVINTDPQGMDNMNMFNDLVMNLINPVINNRNINPLNEMMMQMMAGVQGGEIGNLNNTNKDLSSNNNMNNSNIFNQNPNSLNNLTIIPTFTNNMNACSNEKNSDATANNHATNPNTNTMCNQNMQQDQSNSKIPNVLSGDEISGDNLGDVSKLQTMQQLANAIKMFTGNITGNNSSPNEIISNIPEMFNGSTITNIQQQPLNNNGIETTPNQLGTSNSKETVKDASLNLKQENLENNNSIHPSKPNENLLSDDISMMLLNLLNSSNPQLPLGYDLNSFSQLFDLSNINNLATTANYNMYNINNVNIKKLNDTASNLDEKEKDESNQNITQISANQNNNNMSFNSNNMNMINNANLTNNNIMGANMDFNINPNVHQQGINNNFMGDPILGWMNQFLGQPNPIMQSANTNNIPIFNSKPQNDNYFFNNINPMDLFYDQNMINHTNNNSGNMKNNSEK